MYDDIWGRSVIRRRGQHVYDHGRRKPAICRYIILIIVHRIFFRPEPISYSCTEWRLLSGQKRSIELGDQLTGDESAEAQGLAGVTMISGMGESAVESESTGFGLDSVSREDQEDNEDEDNFSKGSKDLRFVAFEVNDFWVRVEEMELLRCRLGTKYSKTEGVCIRDLMLR